VKIKLDENIPASLAGTLLALGHNVDSVRDEGLVGRDDDAIWAAAQAEGRFLITQDLDFSDIRRFKPGDHHGIMIVRLTQPGRRAVASRIRSVFEAEPVEEWLRAFVVLTDRKLRIKRAP